MKPYVPAHHPRTRWVTVRLPDEGADVPDEELLQVEVRSNPTFETVEAIRLDGSLSFRQLWELMAPHIFAWNLAALNVETGAIEPVPPPAEAGPEAMRMLDVQRTGALAELMTVVHLGGDDRKKDVPPPAAMPSASNGSSPGSPAPRRQARSRTGSPSLVGST